MVSYEKSAVITVHLPEATDLGAVLEGLRRADLLGSAPPPAVSLACTGHCAHLGSKRENADNSLCLSASSM